MKSRTVLLSLALPLVAAFALSGCDQKESSSANTDGDKTASQVEVADWCAEHVVPESVCTRCKPALIAEFKEKGDWCKEHNLPESQCIQCDPSLKAKFEAMAPKDDK